eukprot:CAMPEP_0183306380 /NCGR_PEP_ID=MMETSP0160_2-20130417/10811_1 /TAXON_ID=2839 ORGANISM="Odontella Sinensis, Strain Grunow 1884" /NCGR_SAMPLE_ID=MMETSP0160_2 /ASSEMBLY_ACC=CAM_ASM_000250 /LENGTH=360 /DNA_ID=CAMNT_0025469735 /DNA_START=146 /DNA_END=1225 /DNA_ORIENTATION=+
MRAPSAAAKAALAVLALSLTDGRGGGAAVRAFSPITAPPSRTASSVGIGRSSFVPPRTRHVMHDRRDDRRGVEPRRRRNEGLGQLRWVRVREDREKGGALVKVDTDDEGRFLAWWAFFGASVGLLAVLSLGVSNPDSYVAQTINQVTPVIDDAVKTTTAAYKGLESGYNAASPVVQKQIAEATKAASPYVKQATPYVDEATRKLNTLTVLDVFQFIGACIVLAVEIVRVVFKFVYEFWLDIFKLAPAVAKTYTTQLKNSNEFIDSLIRFVDRISPFTANFTDKIDDLILFVSALILGFFEGVRVVFDAVSDVWTKFGPEIKKAFGADVAYQTQFIKKLVGTDPAAAGKAAKQAAPAVKEA